MVDWSTIQAVSWDLDGTLYSLKKLRKVFRNIALKRLFTGRVISGVRDARMLRHHYLTMAEARARGGDISGIEFPWTAEEYEAVVSRWYVECIRQCGPHEGLDAVMNIFIERGYRQVVVSDLRIGDKLSALAIEDLFEKSYAGEDLGFIKPSNLLFQHVAQDMNIAPETLLHIGDRDDTDGDAARAVGCQVLILGKDFDDYASLLAKIPTA